MKNTYKKWRKVISIAGLLLLCLLVVDPAWAQCPMCKSAAEANLREGGTHGLGLNAGILYLFCTPYLIALTIGILYWWNSRKASKRRAAMQVERMLEEVSHQQGY